MLFKKQILHIYVPTLFLERIYYYYVRFHLFFGIFLKYFNDLLSKNYLIYQLYNIFRIKQNKINIALIIFFKNGLI